MEKKEVIRWYIEQIIDRLNPSQEEELLSMLNRMYLKIGEEHL